MNQRLIAEVADLCMHLGDGSRHLYACSNLLPLRNASCGWVLTCLLDNTAEAAFCRSCSQQRARALLGRCLGKKRESCRPSGASLHGRPCAVRAKASISVCSWILCLERFEAGEAMLRQPELEEAPAQATLLQDVQCKIIFCCILLQCDTFQVPEKSFSKAVSH